MRSGPKPLVLRGRGERIEEDQAHRGKGKTGPLVQEAFSNGSKISEKTSIGGERENSCRGETEGGGNAEEGDDRPPGHQTACWGNIPG